MADLAVQHDSLAVYEPSLFGTYSKKIGMWLFLLSDSLTFGALLFAYTYNRIYAAWPHPFHQASIRNATIMTAFLLTSSLTMVLAVRAAIDHRRGAQMIFLLATMACGTGFVLLHGMEWTHLIQEGMTVPAFKGLDVPHQKTSCGPEEPGTDCLPVASVDVPQFPATFFGLTGMHMLHVTIGVIYLGIIAMGRKFIPILLVLWFVAWWFTPSYSPFHYGAHALLLGVIITGIIVWLKPKVYDSGDVEVAGLYWHFVDLVWMFIFPLVYLMSTKV